MVWSLRFDRDGWSIKSGEKKGRAPPDWYLDRPELPDNDPSALFVLNAYARLTTARRYSGGPIPWDVFVVYGDKQGLSPAAAEAVWEAISAMDRAERDWHKANPRKKADGGDDG